MHCTADCNSIIISISVEEDLVIVGGGWCSQGAGLSSPRPHSKCCLCWRWLVAVAVLTTRSNNITIITSPQPAHIRLREPPPLHQGDLNRLKRKPLGAVNGTPRNFTSPEKAPTRVFSLLKEPTKAFNY